MPSWRLPYHNLPAFPFCSSFDRSLLVYRRCIPLSECISKRPRSQKRPASGQLRRGLQVGEKIRTPFIHPVLSLRHCLICKLDRRNPAIAKFAIAKLCRKGAAAPFPNAALWIKSPREDAPQNGILQYHTNCTWTSNISSLPASWVNVAPSSSPQVSKRSGSKHYVRRIRTWQAACNRYWEDW